jgi:transmembrane sensor
MSTPLPASDQARIDDEASDWIVRSSERPLTEQERTELDAWRAADPRHDRTFVAMRRTWDEIPNLVHLSALAQPKMPPEPLQQHANEHRSRYALARLSAIAAALLAIIFLPMLLWPRGHDYATPVAQTRLIALPDGSQVTLGPKSSLDVEFSESERRVRLTGEAFFEVVHDASRPFFVEAGSVVVRDVGTKFDVNQATDTVRVAVLEGAVQVTSAKPKSNSQRSTPQLLRAGQRVELALATAISVSDTEASMPARAAPAAAPPGAWREGRLSYDNARLGDVIADLNRYYAPGVTLEEPRLGNLRVTASFKAREIPAFMATLNQVLPVRTYRQTDGAVRVQPLNS